MSSNQEQTPPSTTRPHARIRARTACTACRQRKRKCSFELPCSMCTAYGYTCQYPADNRPSAAFVSSAPNVDVPVQSATSQSQQSQPSSPLAKRARTEAAVSPSELVGAVGPLGQNVSKSPSPPTEQGILDPFKARYMSQHSAIAFPRSLGMDFQSANPPPLHSFAYNCGIRDEERGILYGSLQELLSHDEFKHFAAVYFRVVNKNLELLDQRDFMLRCEDFWTNNAPDVVLGALIAGVTALGSFFSLQNGHPQELPIVSHAKMILEDPTVGRRPSMDQVTASVLRTIYLRATTRPHVTWLSSCTTLHLAEAIGLHHDVSSLVLTTTTPGAPAIALRQAGVEQSRKLFWLAYSMNTMISYEYGRSSVHLPNITCAFPSSDGNNLTFQFISLTRLIPSDKAAPSVLINTIHQLATLDATDPYISCTQADLAFCLYRRLRTSKQALPATAVTALISVGDSALVSAKTFATQKLPWWNGLGCVFQYVCVLLAIDTEETLDHVQGALRVLEALVQSLETHLAREALRTVRVLIRDLVGKKRRELGILEIVDESNEQENMMQIQSDGDIDWDELFKADFAVLDGFQNYI